MRAISLMYHDVMEDATSRSVAPVRITSYSVEYSSFLRHLASIPAAATVETISESRRWNKEIPVFLTFDDGEESAYTRAAGALEKHNWRGHFFVTTNWIGRPGFMTREQIRELHERGHVMGSHSCSHPERMSMLSHSALVEEWTSSCGILSEIVGRPVVVASVPAGYYSRKVGESAAEAGLQVLFTSEPTSRTWFVGECLVLGRYAIQGHMPADASGAIVQGTKGLRWRQAAAWQTKKAVKAATGESYFTIRRRLLALLGRQDAATPSHSVASAQDNSQKK